LTKYTPFTKCHLVWHSAILIHMVYYYTTGLTLSHLITQCYTNNKVLQHTPESQTITHSVTKHKASRQKILSNYSYKCHTTKHWITQNNTQLQHITLCYTRLYSDILYHTGSIIIHSGTKHSIISNYLTQCHTIFNRVTLHHTVSKTMKQYNTTWHSVKLYYTVSRYIKQIHIKSNSL